MLLPLSPDELLSTTRSVRRRLDFTRPVPREVLSECAELALQAPTGSLRQDWHLVLTNDREQCRRVGEVYRRIWLGLVSDGYLQKAAAAEPDPAAQASWLTMMDSAQNLAEHVPYVPSPLCPCIARRWPRPFWPRPWP